MSNFDEIRRLYREGQGPYRPRFTKDDRDYKILHDAYVFCDNIRLMGSHGVILDEHTQIRISKMWRSFYEQLKTVHPHYRQNALHHLETIRKFLK